MLANGIGKPQQADVIRDRRPIFSNRLGDLFLGEPELVGQPAGLHIGLGHLSRPGIEESQLVTGARQAPGAFERGRHWPGDAVRQRPQGLRLDAHHVRTFA